LFRREDRIRTCDPLVPNQVRSNAKHIDIQLIKCIVDFYKELRYPNDTQMIDSVK